MVCRWRKNAVLSLFFSLVGEFLEAVFVMFFLRFYAIAHARPVPVSR